jgi:hypothetical protein
MRSRDTAKYSKRPFEDVVIYPTGSETFGASGEFTSGNVPLSLVRLALRLVGRLLP